MNRPSPILGLLLSSLAVPAPRAGLTQGDPTEPPPSVTVTRTAGRITLDGRLGDPGWAGATEITRFYEASPGNNVEPPVRTTAWITFDSKYLYVAFRCDDPHPSEIRAPAVQRDAVGADQDLVAIGLDTRGDRQSALLFFVNPRGIQGDGVRNDATGDEDFSPDFFWSARARITATGWSAEIRIPFSSLRYTSESLSHWGILLYRNYPRAYRYQLFSEPMPRGTNCEMCHAMRLEGLRGLPVSHHLVVAPHTTAQKDWQPVDGHPGTLDGTATRWREGVDTKWSPGADDVVDLTLNPDFSQVEADKAQITANQRFALFYPEKRPFFMEGVDLLQTPIQAVYTRTVTDPRWGARVTGRTAGTDYAFITARDLGGGSVVIPGPLGSSLAPQDFTSQASILRIRRSLGRSSAGLLLTDREDAGGGYNRVAGPDFQWSPTAADRITGQALFSVTRTPRRPDLFPSWDGRRFSGGDAALSWSHDTRGWSWLTQYGDVAPAFRAEDGFVPRVGYRAVSQRIGYSVYPSGLLTKVTPTAVAGAYWSRSGALLERTLRPGVEIEGRNNLQADVFYKSDAERVGSALLHASRISVDAALSPSRVVPQIGLSATLGQDFDYANARVGTGGDVSASVSFRLFSRLGLGIDVEHQWLTSAGSGDRGRLFTADAGRIEGLWTLSERGYVRAIAQYVVTRRDPSFYPYAVARTDGSLQTSLLYSYRLNWQTALDVGYGDQRSLTTPDGLSAAGRQLFFKVSYALQR
ncbi:MAG: carbohydrate binding family 9 domain-containing protein [Gemmatimonadetes bacterium]|nr:carbohydrate binding family 9 domain-containing protein [Gemmatimonadota bacterium]